MLNSSERKWMIAHNFCVFISYIFCFNSLADLMVRSFFPYFSLAIFLSHCPKKIIFLSLFLTSLVGVVTLYLPMLCDAVPQNILILTFLHNKLQISFLCASQFNFISCLLVNFNTWVHPVYLTFHTEQTIRTICLTWGIFFRIENYRKQRGKKKRWKRELLGVSCEFN